tara:strand:+ start:446 stop:1108 length:663 start_codon:yes stop_codon:yes gene_type:complete
MLRSIAIIALFLGSILSSLASELTWDRTEARIELLPHETEVRAVYKVTNNSDAPLRINKLENSSGSTLSKIDRRILYPGDTATVTGIFNKGKRQGENHSTIKVFLEGRNNPAAVLGLVAQIPVLIEASPRILYWKSDSLQQEQQIELLLDTRYVNQIADINYDSVRLNVKKESRSEPIPRTILHVSPKRYDVPFRDTIVIYASGPKGMRSQTRIHIFVQP